MYNLKSAVMKKIMKFALSFAMLGLVFTSCEKDTFTEEDAMEAQQSIDLVINVLDRSNFNNPLDSAVVLTNVNGESVEAVTDETGSIIIEDVTVGATISVIVKKNNYLNAFTTVSSTTNNYRQGQITGTVYMYALTGGNVATVKGRLTLESDFTNREREGAAGVVVMAKNIYLNDYAEQFFFDSTDAEGNYEIVVPVRTDGSNYIDVSYPTIFAKQSFAKMLNDYTIQVVEREVQFRADNYSSNVYAPVVPSAYLTIDAPAGVSLGSGLVLDAVANPSALSSYSSYQLIAGGSGFFSGGDAADVQFLFNEGVNGVAAAIQVDIEGGSIVNIDGFVDNGAVYTTKPSIIFTDGGSGANIDIRFQTTYDVFVKAGGSEYSSYPQVAVTVPDYTGATEYLRVDDDINDGTDPVLGYYYVFDYATIAGGVITANSSNGDTLITTSPFAGVPVFEVFNDDQSVQAIVSLDYNNISSADGDITGYSIEENGDGYDPLNPPVVTVNVVAGMGSGAILRSEVNSAGLLTNIEILQGGVDFARNVNDFRDNGTVSNGYEGPSYPQTGFNVTPTQVIVQDVYYGTGYSIVTKEVEE